MNRIIFYLCKCISYFIRSKTTKVWIGIIILLSFKNNLLYSQNTQRFTRDFSNGNVYGSITIKTKPLTLSEPYLLVRIENITIEGIKYYKGSDISFPINCKNCYADISGSAQMNIRSVLGVRAGDFITISKVRIKC